LITAIYIIAQNVLLGSIFVFFTILRPIPQFLMNNKLKNSGDEMSQGRTAVHNQISDSIRGAQTLRMNQALPENSQRVWNINLRYQRAIQKFAFTHNIVFFCNGFMVFLSQVLPLVLGFFLAMHGHHVSVASLVAMYIAAGQLVGPIQNIMYDVVEVQGAKTTAEKIFGILNRADDSESDNHSISQVEELEISHLSKSYNGREIIRDLNLAIRQG
ncbi:ABC transporter ATP-binding protein, partial [Streptococcus parasanguinis]